MVISKADRKPALLPGLAVRPHVEMGTITVGDLKRHMRQYLAAFKVPKQVE